MSMPSGGLRQPGGGLRAAIARQVTTEVSATRRSAKVKVKVRKRNMPRGFRNAPRAVNSPAGWRHPVLGSGGTRWVSQLGKPGWFDEPLRSHRVAYQRAVRQAMDATADRIARRT
ncbi:MAG TPA: hypothetical protein VFG99_08960 [Chloroflexia bacterium]|nr:hypothetical protein [Chloroflexia bacterium]